MIYLSPVDPSEDYYLMSDALPADKELRVRLQRKRLVRVNVAIRGHSKPSSWSSFDPSSFHGYNQSSALHHDVHVLAVTRPSQPLQIRSPISHFTS